MITERTLRQWRKDALTRKKPVLTHPVSGEQLNIDVLYEQELNNRIIRLTQDLLDLHLMRKE